MCKEMCRKESLFQGMNQIVQSLLEILQAKLAAQKAVKRTLKLIDCNNTRIWASRMLYGVSQLRQRLLFILKSSGYSFAHNLDSWGIEFNGSINIDERFCLNDRKFTESKTVILLMVVYAKCEQFKYFEMTFEPPGWPEYCSTILGVEVQKNLLRLDTAQIKWPSEILDEISCKYSYPQWIAEAIIASTESDEDALQLAEAFNHPGPITLRVNSHKTSREELMSLLQLTPNITCYESKISSVGVKLMHSMEINNSEYYKLGYFDVMDEGSQLISIAALDNHFEGSHDIDEFIVVDYCAGRGGKSLHLYDMMRSGVLVCHDVDKTALDICRQRFKKYGTKQGVSVKFVVSNSTQFCGGRGGDVDVIERPSQSINGDSDEMSLYRNKASVVLVDAPCSSLGTTRRGPSTRWETCPTVIATMPAIQKKILAEATKLVKLRGVMVYSTCTFNKSENEDVCNWFDTNYSDSFSGNQNHDEEKVLLQKCSDGMEKFSSSKSSSLGCIWTHLSDTDTFFACKWKRVS